MYISTIDSRQSRSELAERVRLLLGPARPTPSGCRAAALMAFIDLRSTLDAVPSGTPFGSAPSVATRWRLTR